ncbi:hypothetical protein R69608_05140 [Paraburkholderia nemoris]|nr:hypothetical protein R69608_05140 [Paraburkholderia nemoris]
MQKSMCAVALMSLLLNACVSSPPPKVSDDEICRDQKSDSFLVDTFNKNQQRSSTDARTARRFVGIGSVGQDRTDGVVCHGDITYRDGRMERGVLTLRRSGSSVPAVNWVPDTSQPDSPNPIRFKGDIASWSGIPPLPPHSSKTQISPTQAHCSATDIMNHSADAWMSRTACDDWIKEASDLNKRGPTQSQVTNFCMTQGVTYQQAASYRDEGMSPQSAFASLKSLKDQGINEGFLKGAINRVYFDPGFVNSGGEALRDQMANMCLHPQGLFKPLK